MLALKQVHSPSFAIPQIAFKIIFLALFFYQCKVPEPNDGLFLPDGFEAVVVVDKLEGKARQLAVNDNGDLYVKLRYSKKGGGIAAIRDVDGDGKADQVKRFGQYDHQGKHGYQTAMRIHNGYLYMSTELAVYRFKLDPDKLVPTGQAELIFLDDHEHGDHEHNAKPIAFDKVGNLYIPFGAPSNSCQNPKRTPGMPGMDPCPQLANHGGIWRFDANKTNLRQEDGCLYASGIRSVVAMTWNPEDDNLFVVMHGRDDLLRLFPSIYSPWESALLPSEEFLRVTEGAHFGWPYCYYDQLQEKKVLAPEYGGDGDSIGRCSNYDLPIMGFPGHWAPNDLHFYQGDQFPEHYKNGAFIAFHGSTNRAPYPQSGYFIGFMPFKDGKPSGAIEVFVDGFAKVDPIINVSDAVYRPMGIAEAPDGSLYISETEKGKVWRITFRGNKIAFGAQQLLAMEERKKLAHIRQPDPINDNLQKDQLGAAANLYYMYCGICHQANGRGASGRFPPLAGTDWVTGDKERLIKILLNGMEGSIDVNGEVYVGLMPQHSFLSDEELAEILTYIRQNFGNKASAVTTNEVMEIRQALNL